ncbi:MAG: CPBP family intramembrane metalloprotease [Bacillota bacterium]|nr:CPBP family intramembrane metalloprotease [Bacillota bacterium]
MRKELSIKTVISTFIVFIAIWSIRTALLKTFIDDNFTLWTKEIINGLIKSIIWAGFAYYFIKKYDDQLSIKYNQMLRSPIMFKVLLPLIGVVALYHILSKIIVFGGLYFNHGFHPSQLIGTVFLAGILEEFLFRGWFYNGISSVLSENKAIIISSILFVLIHYPKYIVASTTIPVMLLSSIGIFVAGVIFGWSFKKSKSLWVPIILHMIWNIVSITIGVV